VYHFALFHVKILFSHSYCIHSCSLSSSPTQARAAARAQAAVIDELLELRAEVARYRAGGGPTERLELHARHTVTPAQLAAAAAARDEGSGISTMALITLAAVAVAAFVTYSNIAANRRIAELAASAAVTGSASVTDGGTASGAGAAGVSAVGARPTVVNPVRVGPGAGATVGGGAVPRSRMLFKDYDDE